MQSKIWRITLQLTDQPQASEKHLISQEIFDMLEKVLSNLEAGISFEILGIKEEK